MTATTTSTTTAAPCVYTLLYAATRNLLDIAIEDLERLRNPRSAAEYVHAAVLLTGLPGDLLVEETATGPTYRKGPQAVTRAGEASAYSVVTLTPEQAAAGLAFLTSEMGSRYAAPQIVMDAFNLVTGDHIALHLGRAMVCSGLTAACLQACGMTPPKPAGAITPADLARWPSEITVGAPTLGL